MISWSYYLVIFGNFTKIIFEQYFSIYDTENEPNTFWEYIRARISEIVQIYIYILILLNAGYILLFIFYKYHLNWQQKLMQNEEGQKDIKLKYSELKNYTYETVKNIPEILNFGKIKCDFDGIVMII